MNCASPECRAPLNDLRSGGICAVDFLGGSGASGECQIIQRRVIWLCDACSGMLTDETWRPPEEQVRPSGRPRTPFPRARGQKPPAQSWS